MIRLRYGGSAYHKRHPGDFGFIPSSNPRPSKSLCDGLRPVLYVEAAKLFRRGIELGMMSKLTDAGIPKYVWAVDGDNEVYEAKTKAEREVDYHGYRLGADEADMRRYIREEWEKRCELDKA